MIPGFGRTGFGRDEIYPDRNIYIYCYIIYILYILYIYIICIYIYYILVLIVGVINVKPSLVYINPPISTVNVNFVTLVMWVISKTPKKSGFPLYVFFDLYSGCYNRGVSPVLMLNYHWLLYIYTYGTPQDPPFMSCSWYLQCFMLILGY